MFMFSVKMTRTHAVTAPDIDRSQRPGRSKMMPTPRVRSVTPPVTVTEAEEGELIIRHF